MSTILLRLHCWFVVLYFVVALIFFVKNLKGQWGESQSWLRKFVSIQRILLIIIFGTGFLLTLLVPVFKEDWFKVKLVLSLASIAILFLSTKRNSKFLFVIGLLTFVYTWFVSDYKNPWMVPEEKVLKTKVANIEENVNSPDELGPKLYELLCLNCHGVNGDAEIYEAKNLRTSVLDDDMKAYIIKNGKGYMPSHTYLNSDEVKALVDYVNKFSSAGK